MDSQYIIGAGIKMHRYDFESEHVIEDFEEWDDDTEPKRIFLRGYEVHHLIWDVIITFSIVVLLFTL
jgi:hypothetical protein